jgi:regulator of protease activity HflC (stomatin/prohibitin superfamily)
MGIIILFGLFGLVVIGGLASIPLGAGWRGGAVAGGALVLGVIIWLFVAITPVGPSDVGIVTFGGHTVGKDLGPGYHYVSPWDNVTIWDDSVQPANFSGKGCLQIRVAGSQSACLNVRIQWRDNPRGSDAQYKKYRGSFSRLTNTYMQRLVIEGLFNNVFEKYDPVANAQQTASGKGGTTVTSLTAQVASNIRSADKGEISIISVSSGNILYDAQVEQALNSLTEAAAKTNVAAQNEKTAEDQKIAADTLASAHLTPAVLFQECLNDTLELTNPSPAWNCTSEQNLSLLLNGRK